MAGNFEFGGFRQNANELGNKKQGIERSKQTPSQATHQPKRHYFNMIYELSEPTSPTRVRPAGKVYKTELCDEEDNKTQDEELTL